MKKINVILLSFLTIFIAVYLAFLFILPYAIDLNKYSPQITKAIQDYTGFHVDIENLKVKTSWNLSLGAIIKKTDLKYPTGEKFAQINDLQVRLSLLPLFLGNFKLDKIEADKLILQLSTDKDGKLLIEKYLNKKQSQKPAFKLKYSKSMPDIMVKKYRISLVNGQNTYSAKGSDLRIFDFILDKKIKFKTNGNLVLNNRNQVAYKIAIYSKVFPKGKKSNLKLAKIFDDLYKYKAQANIDTNLKITGDDENTDIDGHINLDKISFALAGKTFPQSNLNLEFSGNKAKISSVFYDLNSKITVDGWFKNGQNKSVDLQVISDKINVENLLLMAKTMSKTFGIKNLEGISANGFIKANFNVKSDFKKVQSNGYLKVENTNITNKLYNVAIKSINADIDFSQDAIKIKQATAKINSQPIIIKGLIDKNAVANILISAQNLDLRGLLLASGGAKILKENDILSGIVNVKASLQGRLDKATPKVNVFVSNINLKNKQTKARINLEKAIINLDDKSKSKSKNNGRAELTGLKISPNPATKISAPKITLTFDDKDLTIQPTYLYLNNIRTNLSGKISDMKSTPKLNSINITIPNQISVPIAGCADSSMVLKGNLSLIGTLDKPEIQGEINVPLIRIPTASISLKNTTLKFGKISTISCPQVQIADSIMNFDAQLNDDFSKGIVAKNVNFNAENINLNGIIQSLKSIPKGSNTGLTITNGISKIEKFKIAGIVSNNIMSEIALKNNILYINDIQAEAYVGKVKGDISYDFIRRKTKLNLLGRGLSANPALIALTGRNDDINGVMDFDSNISMAGYSKYDLLNSLNGSTNFIIHNGKMGVLGKFEHLLYAQNILSNSFFKASLNLVAKAITVKNTGVYRYMKGKITFNDGWANIIWVKTSGPSMSLYINGRYNLFYNTANLTILGRISDDIVRILGPIGEFSMDKIISHFRINETASSLVSLFTINPNYENTSEIPYLTPKTQFATKEFKVIIDGEVNKQSSVKSFKWISNPVIQSVSEQSIPIKKELPAVPDFVNKLPDLKN